MSAAAAIALLRRFGPLALFAAAVAAALFFRAQRDDVQQTLTNERAAWSAEVDRADRARAEQELRHVQQLSTATATFADRLAAREPIILHSTNTVREYAQTDAGRARCLGADRVRGLDSYLAALTSANSAAAAGRADAVPAHADPSPNGR